MMNDSNFPEALASTYAPVTCLKASAEGSAYLAEDSGGARVLIKISRNAEALENEARMLAAIAECADAAFPRAPRLVPLPDGMALVRKYVPGQSLEQLVEQGYERPGLLRGEALRIVTRVAEAVARLHAMTPPVLHRDIKPQNVIVQPDSEPVLIDFGIARRPGESAARDTRVMGTRLTAPPEQFGYRATDERSDIYSLGVLLRYALTGDYELTADRSLDADLRRIVVRATHFDPERRYRNVRAMLRALRDASNVPRRRRRRTLLLGAALALIAAATLAPSIWMLRPYTFYEPLIESAVRAQLDLPEGPVTRDDLLRIEELHLFGACIYESDDQFFFQGPYTIPTWASLRETGLWEQNGGIERLDDVLAMPNLNTLSVYRQKIADLTPLQGTKIEALGIGFNPINDLEPLRGNANLKHLNLICLPVDDTDVLRTLVNLRELCIAGTEIASLDGLSALPIEQINLHSMYPDSFAALCDMPALKSVISHAPYPALLSALNAEGITSLWFTMCGETDLSDYAIFPNLETLNLRSGAEVGEEPLLDGPPVSFPSLTHLTLKGYHLKTLTPLSGAEQLRSLSIRECVVDDRSGLTAFRSLRELDDEPLAGP